MATPAGLVAWCAEQLRGGFGLDVGEELVQYLLSIENEEEIREYVADLVQGTDGKKKLFVDELIARWQKSGQPTTSDPLPLYQKKDDPLEAPRSGDQAKRGRRKGRNKQEVPVHIETNQLIEEVKTPLDLAKAQEINSGSTSAKKKMKYVNLYTKEGQDKLAVMLPGRHPCECLAQKHKLINNCLTCGRIVCEQEGSGPCLFCGTLVCTKEEQDVLQRDSNKSQKLLKKLLGGSENSGKVEGVGTKDLLPQQEARLKANLEMAVKHKDKLLEFDRTSVRRTQVIDDESDYFATDSNQWLSKQEREVLEKREKELRQLRHASRLSMKITLDFAGRHVLEDNDSLAEYHSKLDETVEALQTGTLIKPMQSPEGKHSAPGVLVNPNLLQPAPVWVDQTGLFAHRKTDPSAGGRSEADSERSRLRIQDREIQEISDDGWCLSMHQPWASLLVKGIKRVEGRTWYTAVRGRLWIAATARRPPPQEICELEASYKVLLSKDLEFPKDYPSGCLLGCVDLIDCLSQEQFREQYPQLSQESSSPFVFICSNPREMIVKFPVKGKHKIWKLDSKIHQGAKKGLMRQKAAM